MSHSANGLYDPRYEHDSCGFGLIAQLDDHPSRLVVDGALQALAGLNHRGAVAADGRSGDGCGVLIRRPDAWLRALAAEAGIADHPHISAGLVFLSHDAARAERAVTTLEAQLVAHGVQVLGWRRRRCAMTAISSWSA